MSSLEGGPMLVDQAEIDVEHYCNHSSFQFQSGESTLALHRFLGDESVLDVGCGDGRLTKVLAEKVPKGKVCGIDPSLSMLHYARENYPQESCPNLHFEEGIAENFCSDIHYDLITAFCSIHWVDEKKQAFENFVKQLNPRGKLLILTCSGGSEYARLLNDVVHSEKWSSYAHTQGYKTSFEEYKQLATEKGLKVCYAQCFREMSSYENLQELKDYVKGWLPCLISLPESLQDEFLTDLALLAKERCGNPQSEQIDIPYNKVVMYLEKAEKKT